MGLQSNGARPEAKKEDPTLVVAVVHANTVMRVSFGDLIRRQPDIRLAGSFASVSDLLDQGPEEQVIIIYDFDTARRAGSTNPKELHGHVHDAKILMVNVPDDDQAIIECARAGVAGFLLDDASLEDLKIALRSVADGVPPASPRVITSLFSYLANHRAESERMPDAQLTAREKKILELLAGGYGNKEIAKQLFLQPQTVKNYTRAVYEKLGVHSRLELIRLMRSQSPMANSLFRPA